MTETDQNAIDDRFMTLALDEATRAGAMGEVPVGAIVYRGDELIASAHNRREVDQDPTAHAEIVALREASHVLSAWRLENCSMAVTLEPCPMCAGALVNARVDRLVYGASDPKMGSVHTLHELCTDARFNHRIEVIAGVRADECARLLKDFFRQLRS